MSREEDGGGSGCPLPRVLGLRSAFSVVAGSVIGSGVFLVATDISRALPSPGAALLTWLAAGAFSIVGGLVFSELGAMYPGAGGQYVYLNEAFGPLWGFLFSWTHTWVLQPGTMAALAAGFAQFASALVPLPGWRAPALGTVALLFFTGLNLLGARRGAQALDRMTDLKLLALGALVLGATGFALRSDAGLLPAGAVTGLGWASVRAPASSYVVGLIAAFWAFDGWNGLSQVAGEIRDPRRNIPLATVSGLLVVTALYLAVNAAYLRVLSPAALAGSPFAASDLARAIWGGAGARAMSWVIVLSTLGCLSGTILTGARVTYAAAADGRLPRFLARVSPRFGAPSGALLFQMLWSVALVWSGRYDQLYSYVICAALGFYALTAAAMLRLRISRPVAPRPYRAPRSLAWVYLVLIAAFVLKSFFERPWEAALGYALVAAGVPVFMFSGKTGREPRSESRIRGLCASPLPVPERSRP